MQDTKNHKAYLLVGGVNIYASAYDTSQLSIVRGSSLLLKWAVELLDSSHKVKQHPLTEIIQAYNKKIASLNDKSRLEPIPDFEPPKQKLTNQLSAVTTGASSGIFGIDTDESEKLDHISSEISKYLNDHPYLHNFTFTLAWVTSQQNETFASINERLLGKTRRQQLRQISLAPTDLPDKGDESAEPEPCALQGILAAHSVMPFPPKTDDNAYAVKFISRSCQNRFMLGRYLRHGLYISELQALLDSRQNTQEINERTVLPTQSEWSDCGKRIEKLKTEGGYEAWLKSLLGQLAFYDAAESFNEIRDREDYLNLENKIAVFYADGNGFGGIQAKGVKTVKDQRHFDHTLKTYRREFLACLLQQWMPEGGKGILPLETLLWGGDEMMFVVPASKGFALAQMFYQHSRNWSIELDGKKHKLTHAGGLVFCHYKTPIGRVKQLAQELAEGVKEQKYGRKGNYFDYAVLESIDYPAESLDEFFNKRYGALAKHRFPLQPLAAAPDVEHPPATGMTAEYPQHNAPAFKWVEQVQPIAEFLEAMPKSQAYQIAQATQTDAFEKKLERFYSLQKDNPVLLKQLEELIQNGVLRLPPKPTTQSDKSDAAKQEPATAELGEESTKPEIADQAHESAVMTDPWQWLHLVELWDYLVPRKKAQVKGGTPS